MKLWVLSDLHRDWQDWGPLYVPEADACVCAGDVGQGLVKSMQWLQRTVGEHMPVVMVAGNHEFYRHSVVESYMDARAVADTYPDVYLLEDSSLVIGGVRFLGATLWTDYEVMTAADGDLSTATGDRALAREWAMEVARSQLNDHRAIALQKHPWQRWTPAHAARRHAASRAFIEATLAQPFDGPTVVVTHHAPHPGSIHPRYAGQSLNAAFASDLSAVIEKGQPDLWVHGHVHDCHDYEVGRTRVLCNPKGYADENKVFVPDLVVEVEPKPEMKP